MLAWGRGLLGKETGMVSVCASDMKMAYNSSSVLGLLGCGMKRAYMDQESELRESKSFGVPLSAGARWKENQSSSASSYFHYTSGEDFCFYFCNYECCFLTLFVSLFVSIFDYCSPSNIKMKVFFYDWQKLSVRAVKLNICLPDNIITDVLFCTVLL